MAIIQPITNTAQVGLKSLIEAWHLIKLVKNINLQSKEVSSIQISVIHHF